MFNQVVLIGNLGKDPEIKTLKEDNEMATFSIATTERYKKDDEWVDKTEWHNIVVWQKGAVTACKNTLQKGTTVYVVGKMTTRKYEKDGQTHYSTEVQANQVKAIKGWKERQRTGSTEAKPELDDEPPF